MILLNLFRLLQDPVDVGLALLSLIYVLASHLFLLSVHIGIVKLVLCLSILHLFLIIFLLHRLWVQKLTGFPR